MVIRTTRWTPDTCSCIIEYTWDDSIAETSRVHNLDKVVTRCPEHQLQGGNDTVTWNTINEENPRKNRAIDEIILRAPDVYIDIAADGTRALKPNITIDFEWTGIPPNRVIRMIVKGVTLPQNHFDALQTRLNTRFGAGKVILVNV